jgi:hypothetical protein
MRAQLPVPVSTPPEPASLLAESGDVIVTEQESALPAMGAATAA